MTASRAFVRERRQALVSCALVVILYFVVPVEPDVSTLRVVLRGVATFLGVLVVAVLVVRRVRRQAAGGGEQGARDLISLAVALVVGLMSFALADYVIQVSDPIQFTGLQTRIDALYFALTTATTVGYGDVHATGQLARTVVIVQMLFSIGVIATGASLLFKQASETPGR